MSDAITAAEAARMLAIGESTLWRKVSERELPQPVKIGSATRWRVADLVRYVESLADAAASKEAP